MFYFALAVLTKAIASRISNVFSGRDTRAVPALWVSFSGHFDGPGIQTMTQNTIITEATG